MKSTVFPVALCCNSIEFFLQAHAWTIAKQRSAILLSKQDWRHLKELAADFDHLTVLSDTPDHPALAPFTPTLMEPVEISRLPAAENWPEPLSILLTSGSTGKPKQIVKTSHNILGEQASFKELFPAVCTDVLFITTVPLEHMFGYTFGYWLPTLLGAEIHAKRLFLPQDVRRACSLAKKPIWLVTTPTHIRAYISLNHRFSNIAGVICATAPLSSELARRGADAFGVAITEIYGCTETGAIATRLRLIDETNEPDWSPLPGMSITITVDGESTCWADHLPAPVALGDLLEPGQAGFRIKGRRGDLVKVAGKRQSLSGLNNILLSIPGVRDGTYFFPKSCDAEHQEVIRPVIFVVMEGESRSANVATALRGRVDDVFIPRNTFQVDVLPRLDTGKLRESDLEQMYQAHHS